MKLQRLTTLRTGGIPACYFRPGTATELRCAFGRCRELALPWRVLGGGSNLLVEEGRLPYAVIHVHEPGFARISPLGDHGLRVGAGVSVARLLARCRQAGLGGLEFLTGLPGTVGGAVAGNAGAQGRNVADRLTQLHVMDASGRELRIPHEKLEFSYRRCGLAEMVVVGVEFDLEPREPRLIARRMRAVARQRAERLPAGIPSAGCIFKNPAQAPAGKMLDLCNMKGQKVGGARVSEKHANIIVNDGKATARDVLELIERMRNAVCHRFGVELELEVRHWPALGRVA